MGTFTQVNYEQYLSWLNPFGFYKNINQLVKFNFRRPRNNCGGYLVC